MIRKPARLAAFAGAAIAVSVLVMPAAAIPQRASAPPAGGPLPVAEPATAPSAPYFERNLGQVDKRVAFLARSPSGSAFFTRSSVMLSVPLAAPVAPAVTEQRNARMPHVPEPAGGQIGSGASVIRLRFEGASDSAAVRGGEQLGGRVNYFIGNDPSRWVSGAPTYGSLVYEDLYPGIDLRYDARRAGMKGTYVVAPGADAGAIRWSYEGARDVTIAPSGDLVVHLPSPATQGASGPSLVERAPVAWQYADGTRRPVQVRFRQRADGSLGFALGRYDRGRSLIVDPTLEYSTFLGGERDDFATGVHVDATGAMYVAGVTSSLEFPTTTGAFQPECRGEGPAGGYLYGCVPDAFVTKFDASGSSLVYSTYVGGRNWERDVRFDVGADGTAYLSGTTTSSDFPTTPGSFQPVHAPGAYEDGFVTRLNAGGNALVFSTFLGGEGDDILTAIAVNRAGEAFVVGDTRSTDFPTTPDAFQPSRVGAYDATLTVLEAEGSELVYSTYLGGSATIDAPSQAARNSASAVALDANGAVYVAGDTDAGDFPTTPTAFQAEFPQPDYDRYRGRTVGFAVKVGQVFDEYDATKRVGWRFDYGTYLGGHGISDGTDTGDLPFAIAVNDRGEAYVAGRALSPGFPTTPDAFQREKASEANDAFVTALSADASSILHSTFLGGQASDVPLGLAVDEGRNVYVTGFTTSGDFPVHRPLQATRPAASVCWATVFGSPRCETTFVTKFNPTLSALIYSTYLSGHGAERPYALAVAPDGDAYVVGYTSSPDFPTTADAVQRFGATPFVGDAFVSRISD